VEPSASLGKNFHDPMTMRLGLHLPNQPHFTSRAVVSQLSHFRPSGELDGIGSETYAGEMNFPIVDGVKIQFDGDSKKSL